MGQIIFFGNVFLDFVNHMVSIYPKIAICTLLIGIIFNFDTVKIIIKESNVDSKKKLYSWYRRIIKLIKHFSWWVIGCFLVFGSRFITSVSISLFSIEGNEYNGAGKRKEEIAQIPDNGAYLGLDNIYNTDVINTIQYIHSILAIRIICLLILAGFMYTISFGNKTWKIVGMLFVITAFLLVVGGALSYLRLIELQAGLI